MRGCSKYKNYTHTSNIPTIKNSVPSCHFVILFFLKKMWSVSFVICCVCRKNLFARKVFFCDETRSGSFDVPKILCHFKNNARHRNMYPQSLSERFHSKKNVSKKKNHCEVDSSINVVKTFRNSHFGSSHKW